MTMLNQKPHNWRNPRVVAPNMGRLRPNSCQDCGNKIDWRGKRCSRCANKYYNRKRTERRKLLLLELRLARERIMT